MLESKTARDDTLRFLRAELGAARRILEVGAGDGLIARASDAAAIHYRMLNASKGAAVRGPRVQADRWRYKAAIRAMIEAQEGLAVVEGEARALRLEGRRVEREQVTVEAIRQLVVAHRGQRRLDGVDLLGCHSAHCPPPALPEAGGAAPAPRGRNRAARDPTAHAGPR